MSRTIRKNDSRNWRHSVLEYAVCMCCGHVRYEKSWHYCPKCKSWKTQCKWIQPKTFRDGKGGCKYTQHVKEYCSSSRRAAEKLDLYNCVMRNDFHYIDTESKCKGALWLFD